MRCCSKFLCALGGSLAFVGFGANADAAIIAQYQIGTTGTETTVETSPVFNPTVVAAGVSATAILDPANSIGLESSSAATTPTNAPFLRIDPQGSAADPNASLTGNKYFQFSVMAGAFQDLDLSSLTFNVARGGGGTPRGFFLASSADNFVGTIPVTGSPAFTANATNAIGNDISTARPTYTAATADLSGASFQNIQSKPGSTLAFRVYIYSPAAGSSVDFDDITVNGTVTPIPEPGTAGLLLAGGLALLARRRRIALPA